MNEPFVSVVIPAAGGADFLGQCLEKVLRQRYEKKEVILVCGHEEAPPIPGDAQHVRVVREHTAGGPAHLINVGMRAAKGDVRVLLAPECVPMGERWLDEMVAPFRDESVGVVVSQCSDAADRSRSVPARLLESVTGARVKSSGPQPRELQTVSHLCDAYRASVLVEVGHLDERAYRSPGEAIDVSLKIAAAGYRIVLSPTAAVLHHDGAQARSLLAVLGKALDYGYSDAVIGKVHGVDWLGSRTYAATVFALLALPVAAINLPVGWILAAALFIWGWFLPLRLPFVRWEVPLALLNLAVYAAIVLSIRDGWLPGVFERTEWHPAVIRQLCFVAAIAASHVLILAHVGVRGFMLSAARDAGVLRSAPMLLLAPIWRMLSGLGFLMGYALGRPNRP